MIGMADNGQMDLVQDVAELRARRPGVPFCVLARPDDDRLIGAALPALGLSADSSQLSGRGQRRPGVLVESGNVGVGVVVAAVAGDMVNVLLGMTSGGLLVVAGDGVDRGAFSSCVGDAQTPAAALAAVLDVLSRQSADRVADLLESFLQSGTGGFDLVAVSRRESLTRMRTRCFALQNAFEAQSRMLGRGNDLADALPDSARELRRAAATFSSTAATCAHLYASLGDALDTLNAAVTERLTVVSTVFLPLTLGASVFGMNFAWMTDHIDSAGAFVLLGLAFPVLLTVITLLSLRRLDRKRAA